MNSRAQVRRNPHRAATVTAINARSVTTVRSARSVRSVTTVRSARSVRSVTIARSARSARRATTVSSVTNGRGLSGAAMTGSAKSACTMTGRSRVTIVVRSRSRRRSPRPRRPWPTWLPMTRPHRAVVGHASRVRKWLRPSLRRRSTSTGCRLLSALAPSRLPMEAKRPSRAVVGSALLRRKPHPQSKSAIALGKGRPAFPSGDAGRCRSGRNV